MEHLEIVKIKVASNMGSNIGYCIQEAICLAAKEWRNVELIHNHRTYMVNVNDLFSTVNETKKGA